MPIGSDTRSLDIDRLATRAATIDELLSDAFTVAPGQKSDADVAARRLAAWCRSCASGDWLLFARRLARDGLTFDRVLPRFAAVRRNEQVPPPSWVGDAGWIVAALREPPAAAAIDSMHVVGSPLPFEHFLVSLLTAADQRVWPCLPPAAVCNFTEAGLASLRYALLHRLAALCAPALYNGFVTWKAQRSPQEGNAAAGTTHYDTYIDALRADGLDRLFEGKPVLLRLIASVTRQWIDATRELVARLHDDLPDIQTSLLRPADRAQIVHVSGALGDSHNFGRFVQLLRFADGARLLYKPKDLRIDALWHSAVERLNRNGGPIDLRAARVLARNGYGWSEYVDHAACDDRGGFERFFRRAGAWLCLIHLFGGTDVHEENIIASGDHPIPIDLEMLFQAAETGDDDALPETHAVELATSTIADSVMMTGLLPAYGRSPENAVYAQGGLNNPQNEVTERSWEHINTDAMAPVERRSAETGLKNSPHFDGAYARLGSYVEFLVAGYDAYAAFMSRYKATSDGSALFEGFAGLPVRRIFRPTRFYSLLLERLTDYRNMGDGAEWSAHLDFGARLMEWNRADDPMWPLLRAERQALRDLNIPYFTSQTDSDDIADDHGSVTRGRGQPGLQRAQGRLAKFTSDEAAWQSEVIRLSTSTALNADGTRGVPDEAGHDLHPAATMTLDPAVVIEHVAAIYRDLSAYALRSGPGAAWIGFDWLGDSEVCQLSPSGADLYNGAPGICLFLAAYAQVTQDDDAARLAVAGMSAVRHELRSAGAARFARALRTGGAVGIGSVAYALTVLSQLLDAPDLLADALRTAALFTSDLIAADSSYDVIDGSAGAVLGLLKVHRASGDSTALIRAAMCGEHLLKWFRATVNAAPASRTSTAPKFLNGMSHGLAGFAYAFASLARATGRGEFRDAAQTCVELENATFSSSHANWPDFRGSDEPEPIWPCQWCHGAGGIGLARIGMLQQWTTDANGGKRGSSWPEYLRADIKRAIDCVRQNRPYPVDTLCCGGLGNIELLREASRCLADEEGSTLREEAIRRTMAMISTADQRGDYLWDVGSRRFNLGFFRGLAGVGYTFLRALEDDLPNVLIWE